MKRIFCLTVIIFIFITGRGQMAATGEKEIGIKVTTPAAPVVAATVALKRAADSSLVKLALTDASGYAIFNEAATGRYFIQVSYTGFAPAASAAFNYPLPAGEKCITMQLTPAATALEGITVRGRRPYIEQQQGKVIINVDAAVTNTGTTVLEVLEKSPGVTVDRNGTISLMAKTGVLVMIDDKPTYLSGAELSALLGGMSSSGVDKIELITSPSAKYDASGNAGIINIKTKKTRQRGFNGTVTTAFGQGRYSKNNNSLILNYRNGRFNAFLNYSANFNENFTDIYALRNYYDSKGNITALLDQPARYKNKGINHTLKTGMDYYLSPVTTVGFSIGGTLLDREGPGYAKATWLNPAGKADSAIGTANTATTDFKNALININGRHTISKTQEVAIDLDWLVYDIHNKQGFNSRLLSQGGYTEGSGGDIPSSIRIFSAKADYTWQPVKKGKLESGIKLSHTATDNTASYQYFNGQHWQEDYGKSNHFLYNETIAALYSSLEKKYGRLSVQAGLRYEHTRYDAEQLGNAVRKDSSFSRRYQNLFPSGYLSYEADSANTFTLTAGRRIDRPAFRSLNPFVFIVNKYTYQRGNPFYQPQYTWNTELSHQYKGWLTTTVAYSLIKDYFSQLFLTDSNNILVYTEGNVGRAGILAVSAAVQLTPAKWWSLSGNAVFSYKKLKGYVWSTYRSEVKQLNLNINNQFRIGPKYTAELSGFYTTRARNDLTELLHPTGQLSVGWSRPVLKSKGTLKCSVRDLFFTQAMEGLTQFQSADEYFIVRRDTRVFNLAFTYRFGKAVKAAKRSAGSAADEMQRAGNG